MSLLRDHLLLLGAECLDRLLLVAHGFQLAARWRNLLLRGEHLTERLQGLLVLPILLVDIRVESEFIITLLRFVLLVVYRLLVILEDLLLSVVVFGALAR